MFEEGQGGWEMVLVGSVAPSSKKFFEGLCVKQLLSGSDTTYLPLLLPHQEIPLQEGFLGSKKIYCIYLLAQAFRHVIEEAADASADLLVKKKKI